MAFMRMLVASAIAAIVGAFVFQEPAVPIEAVVTAVQNGSLGSEGAKDNVYVLGVCDDRLIGGSSLKWPRFAMRLMSSPATTGSYQLYFVAGSHSVATSSLLWNAPPWEIAWKLTLALNDDGFTCAVVPITTNGTPNSGPVYFELRTPENSESMLSGTVIGDLDGDGYYITNEQSPSGSVPSQAGNTRFAFTWPTSEAVGGEYDTAIQSGFFDLSDAQDNSAALQSHLDDLFGSGVGVVEVYAESDSHTWYKITLPGTTDLEVITAGGATNVEIWRVQESDGSIGNPEKQEVSIPGAAGGTFKLTVSNSGETASGETDPIAYDATADDVRDAIRAMPFEPASRGVMVRCVGGPLPETAVRVVFSPLDGNVPLMTAESSGLNSLESPTIRVTPLSLSVQLGAAPSISVVPNELQSTLQAARVSVQPQQLPVVIQGIPSISVVPIELDGTQRVTSARVQIEAHELKSSLGTASVSIKPLSLAGSPLDRIGVDVTPMELKSTINSPRVKITPLALQPRIPRHIQFGTLTLKPAARMTAVEVLRAGKVV